ncbi:cysteine desulfurase [Falseniella ignava]|uniref:cysteine desulfurase n=1 Tax=Falseniella ignava TaxID=137730 RepID=A0A2I1JZ46_9LACT|nr:aminotransferase class V-fold PLP-dependent enzyme [Falseniella ignava]PKY88678.1 cysteine desulfurase [Falseniella ignava]
MIYLDNAATTLRKPQVVIDAVVHALSTLGNAGRGATEESLNSARMIYEARHQINRLINGVSPQHVAFTSNITESLNIAIQGLFLPGDHVITTMMEHNSVLRPLYALEEQGLELTIIPANKSGNIDPKAIEAQLQPNTKGIVVTHASNLTGNINSLNEIGKIAQAHDLLLIVDAAQTLGAYPVDVQAMQCDVLCFTGHKSLLGPQGTGGLYVRPGLEIRPLKSGGTGVETYNKRQPQQMPTHLEAGTMNGHGIAGLLAGVKYVQDYGVEKIHQEEMQLWQQMYQGIKDIDNVSIYGDVATTARCPVLTLNIGDLDSSEVADILLEDYDIEVRSGGHCAPLMHEALGTVEQGAVRFSFGHFTTPEEVTIAIRAVQEIAQQVAQ